MKTKLITILVAVLTLYACNDDSLEFALTDPRADGYLTLEGGDPSGNGNGEYEAGQITAGEWNDLNNWDFFKDVLNQNVFFGLINLSFLGTDDIIDLKSSLTLKWKALYTYIVNIRQAVKNFQIG